MCLDASGTPYSNKRNNDRIATARDELGTEASVLRYLFLQQSTIVILSNYNSGSYSTKFSLFWDISNLLLI
jgi:hypothetical protein